MPETKAIREGDWQIAPLPKALECRRVEITGPVERKMVINALNSGAKCFMADFEDSASPVWSLMMEGQVSMYDAVRKKISFKSPEGKEYKLNKQIATLIVRPRGWHLEEKHILIDGKPAPGGIVDFALYRKRLETFDFDMINLKSGDWALPNAADLKAALGSAAVRARAQAPARNFQSAILLPWSH